MDAFETFVLPASFVLAESICCSVVVMSKAASNGVFKNPTTNTRWTYSKIYKLSARQAIAVEPQLKQLQLQIRCGRQLHLKMCFLLTVNFI